MSISIVTLESNLALMGKTPDNFFDLAVVDPPYGIGIDGQKKVITKIKKHQRKHHEKRNWDNSIPTKEYFDELFRVSKNQIIWGGNYFTEYLKPVKGWIFWYKGQNDLTMSDGELAWTSLDIVTRQVNINRGELARENTLHPTQKPVKLYKWLFSRYAEKGFKILDTHLGSGSSRIAAYDLGFDFYACEVDEKYFNDQEDRFATHISQQNIFIKPPILSEQSSMF